MVIRFRSNLVSGIFGVLVAILLIIVIPTQIETEKTVTYGITSRTIPYAVAGLIGISGLVLIFKSLVLKKDEIKEIVLKQEIPAFAMFGVIILYLFFYEKEWPLCTAVLGCAALALSRCKKWYYYLIVVALTVGLYFLFTEVLYVRLHSVIFGS